MQNHNTFDLGLLKEFPHALVYAFEPEGNNEIDLDSRYQGIAQFSDTLGAYLYAQETMLPIIRSQGIHAIGKEQWIDWVKNIHQHIGYHLLKNLGQEAGKYSRYPIFRWHDGVEFQSAILPFLSMNDTVISEKLNLFCQKLANKYPHPKKDFVDFISLVQKIFLDSTFRQKNWVKDIPYTLAQNKLLKLYDAYYAGKLSTDEGVRTKKIVTLSTPPNIIPTAMDAMFERFSADLSQLNITDQTAVASFVAEVFYQITEIHPFINANGRTATCFMNLLLRAMDYPAIMLRYPGDKEDPTSLYSKAIEQINETREPLASLIHMRLSMQPYEDEHLKSLIEIRVKLITAYHHLKQQFPEFEADKHWQQAIEEMPHAEEIRDERSPYLVDGMKWALSNLEQQKSILIQQRAQLKFKCPLKIELIDEILTQFKYISEEEHGWKSYNKGSLFLFENQDLNTVKMVRDKLSETQACQVSVMFNRDTQMHVVKVEAIQYPQLLSYQNPSLSKPVNATTPGI